MAQLPQRTGIAPFGPLSLLDRDLDEVFEGFFRPMRAGATQFRQGAGALAPAMDITEHDDRFDVHAELPGFSKEDIHVRVEDGRLSIEAEMSSETEGGEGKPVVRERRYGKFVRSLSVGDEIDASAIEANYVDGVLELKLPKREPKEPEARRIEIG